MLEELVVAVEPTAAVRKAVEYSSTFVSGETLPFPRACKLRVRYCMSRS